MTDKQTMNGCYTARPLSPIQWALLAELEAAMSEHEYFSPFYVINRAVNLRGSSKSMVQILDALRQYNDMRYKDAKNYRKVT